MNVQDNMEYTTMQKTSSQFAEDCKYIQDLLRESIDILEKYDCSPLMYELDKIMKKLDAIDSPSRENDKIEIENDIFEI